MGLKSGAEKPLHLHMVCSGLKGALWRSPNHSGEHDQKTVGGDKEAGRIQKLTINRKGSSTVQ